MTEIGLTQLKPLLGCQIQCLQTITAIIINQQFYKSKHFIYWPSNQMYIQIKYYFIILHYFISRLKQTSVIYSLLEVSQPFRLTDLKIDRHSGATYFLSSASLSFCSTSNSDTFLRALSEWDTIRCTASSSWSAG